MAIQKLDSILGLRYADTRKAVVKFNRELAEFMPNGRANHVVNYTFSNGESKYAGTVTLPKITGTVSEA